MIEKQSQVIQYRINTELQDLGIELKFLSKPKQLCIAQFRYTQSAVQLAFSDCNTQMIVDAAERCEQVEAELKVCAEAINMIFTEPSIEDKYLNGDIKGYSFMNHSEACRILKKALSQPITQSLLKEKKV